MKLVSGKLMGAIDKYTIDTVGIPGAVLMENAGRGVFEEFILKYSPEKNVSILIICGKGNNGGDGFVVGRYLVNNGYKNVNIILLSESKKLKGDALLNYKVCKNINLDIAEITNSTDFFDYINTGNFDFIFDAVLGTGLNSNVRDFYMKVISFVNNFSGKIIAIDIPSGLHSEKGVPLGNAVKADLTCTFAFKKIGLSTYPGCLFAGDVKVVDISIPDCVPFEFEIFEIDKTLIRKIYKKRIPHGHKGTFGHALIFGGSKGFTGAPVLSAKSALRSGTGLVTTIVPKEINTVVESAFIEGMSLEIDFKQYNKESLLNFINSKNAILIGPGLGTSEEAIKIFFDILKYIRIPIVIDADGLNILSSDINFLNRLETDIILTPHPGEMSRLCNLPTKDIQENRVETVRDFSRKFKVTTILKGMRTVIADEEKIFISPRGTDAIATGGSGDVLSGIIVSFLSQKYSKKDAAILSCYLHGVAGEIAENRKCKEAVIASDIIDNLHFAFKATVTESGI